MRFDGVAIAKGVTDGLAGRPQGFALTGGGLAALPGRFIAALGMTYG